jgi:pSer/pThr/pTyr-binding forkhead associated (FHA) protein
VIGYNEGLFYVRDLGSSNGTFINGTRIRQAVIYLDITLEKHKKYFLTVKLNTVHRSMLQH